MTLHVPFAVYTATSNLEAHLLCGQLIDAGIEAAVVEDVSQVGAWFGGLAPQLHTPNTPRVWIERTDIERARPILEEYEQRAFERRAAESQDLGNDESIHVTCEECGAQTAFPAIQTGSVQNCPKCNAYVDVGDDVEFEGWDETPDEQ